MFPLPPFSALSSVPSPGAGTPPPPPPAALPTPSLYWKFDGNGTDTMGVLNYRDDSGTYTPNFSGTGKFGQALGVYQGYMNETSVLTMFPANNSGWSVSFWLSEHTSNQFDFAVADNRGGGDSVGVRVRNNGDEDAPLNVAEIDAGSNGVTTGAATFDGSAAHLIVVTVSGTTAKLYLDGVLVVTKTITSRAANAVTGFNFASGYAGNFVDDFAVFKSVLTQTHVDYLWNAGTGRVAYPS